MPTFPSQPAAPRPGPEDRGRHRRGRRVGTYLVAAVALTGALVSCADEEGSLRAESDDRPEVTTTEREATATTEPETTTTEPATTTEPTTTERETTTTEPTTTERETTTTEPETTTTAEVGTRENPFPIGTPVTTSEGIQVAVNSVDFDAAGEIAAANQFNEPAPEGSRYILVNVTVTNGAARPITPWLDVTIAAIGSQNQVHSDTDAMVVEPDSLLDAPELYPGGSASGNVSLVVSEVEVTDGSLVLMVSAVFDEPAFVRIA